MGWVQNVSLVLGCHKQVDWQGVEDYYCLCYQLAVFGVIPSVLLALGLADWLLTGLLVFGLAIGIFF